MRREYLMRNAGHLGRLCLVSVIGCSYVALGGCGSQPSEDQMRRLLAKAASAPTDEVVQMLAGSDLNAVSRPTLTSAAIALEPIDRFVGDRTRLGIFSLAEWEEGRPPERCFREISVLEDGSLQRVQGRDSSLLWTDTITSIEMTNEGDRITGEVSFVYPNCFRGRLPFEARKELFGWKIVSFDLPGAGAQVFLGDDGKWQVDQPEWAPIPDLQCRRLPEPVHLRIPAAEEFWLEIDWRPGMLADLEVWTRRRSVTLGWDRDVTFGVFRKILNELLSAEEKADSVFFLTQWTSTNIWTILGTSPSGFNFYDRMSGWITVPRTVWRGQFGSRALPNLWLDRDEIWGSAIETEREWVAPGAGVKNFVKSVAEEELFLPFVVSVEDEVPVGRVDQLLDALRAGGAGKVLLLTDEASGVLLQIKETNMQRQWFPRPTRKSIPLPDPRP